MLQARDDLLRLFGADAMGMVPAWAVDDAETGRLDVTTLHRIVLYAHSGRTWANSGQAECDRAVGAMLGLLVGDALGAGPLPEHGPIRGTCLSQLALFTLEGYMRGIRRMHDKGNGDPVDSLHWALCRWGWRQGLLPGMPDGYFGGQLFWPGGWLHEVAPLAKRRGNAPATVQALRSGTLTTLQPARNSSAGHHALGRTLPIAFLAQEQWQLSRIAAQVAAVTHGDRVAQRAAAAGTVLLARLVLDGQDLKTTLGLLKTHGVDMPAMFKAPADPGTAVRALTAGLDAALGTAASADVVTALTAAAARGGPDAAVFAGALLGAARGVDARPFFEIVRPVELAWVAERLAIDAMTVTGRAYSRANLDLLYPPQ